MKNNIKNILLILILQSIFLSCQQDEYDLPKVEDGIMDVSATVVFSPITGTLDKTRSSGNLIKNINSLCILIYNENNELYRSEMIPVEDIDQEGNDKSPDDAISNNEHQAESKTPRASFSIKDIESGKYRFYAVANMGNIATDENYDVSTPEKLKEIELLWNEDDIASNNQMFGYFTYYNSQESKGFDAPLLTINRSNNQLHAWIKRAASKVTVAIDGRELYPSAEVQIKSIQIKDIPRNCFLGKDNKASKSNLIEDGEVLTVAENVNSTVSKDSPYYFYGMANGMTIVDAQKAAHSETAQALYFYENMQGEGQSKHQVWEGTKPGETQFPDGNNPNSDGYKDKVTEGTYVEVIGYYKNKAGEGPIIYRFMLGKDVDNNYDAQRNYHYKLTLKLKNNANDNDWHIVYDPEPEVIVPNPYYISYTYDETMNLPVKIMGAELVYLQAQIIENGWHAEVPEGTRPNPFPYYEGNLSYLNTAQQYSNVKYPETPKPGVWDGFLSLRKTTVASFGSVEEGYGSNDEKTYTKNYEYWYSHNRGWREYEIKENVVDTKDGNYSITSNGSGEWNASIPLYTRARVMVAQTAYTGNNVYVSYRRKAKVLITAEVRDLQGVSHTVEKEVEIIQMRRIVNPKGIWRSGKCDNKFDVTLMVLTAEDAPDFEPLISDGPWIAVAECGDWYDLTPTAGYSQKNPDGTISGTTDPYGEDNRISFTFKPKGTFPTGSRGGVIKIYYNNYSCIHKIFVRQGYDPVSFYSSNVMWHTNNLETNGSEVSDPVEEGSYFRYDGTGENAKLSLPISASNNTSEWFNKNGIDRDLVIAGSNQTKKWNETLESPVDLSGSTNGKAWRLPTHDDYKAITDDANTIYGYGVLFTDETTYTPTKVEDVYGARKGSTKGKGMRGAFVCDSTTGTQIFFPIGASGYGRFKTLTENNVYNRQQAGYGAVVQYANRYAEMPKSGSSQPGTASSLTYGVEYKPLFWDLWRRPGALYWTDKVPKKDDKGVVTLVKGGLDINYYTLDFAVSYYDNLGLIWPSGGSDAIQIRVVHDN